MTFSRLGVIKCILTSIFNLAMGLLGLNLIVSLGAGVLICLSLKKSDRTRTFEMPVLTFLHSPEVVGETAGSDNLGDFSNRQGATCFPAHAHEAP